MRKQKRETIKLGVAGSAQIANLHVTCDWCVNQGKPKPATFVTRATGTLFDDAARRGWLCQRSGVDVCPACLAEDGQPPVLPPELAPRQLTLFGTEG